jgi:hypothetical protein
MVRANRHYIPGQVWHITHCCQKKEFLLKFARDRRRWHHWLFEARKRFGLQVLNYMDERIQRNPESARPIQGDQSTEFTATLRIFGCHTFFESAWEMGSRGHYPRENSPGELLDRKHCGWQLEICRRDEEQVGNQCKKKRIDEQPDDLNMLGEESTPYNADITPENEALSAGNAYFGMILSLFQMVSLV